MGRAGNVILGCEQKGLIKVNNGGGGGGVLVGVWKHGFIWG